MGRTSGDLQHGQEDRIGDIGRMVYLSSQVIFPAHPTRYLIASSHQSPWRECYEKN
jgi:hypothetical protein